MELENSCIHLAQTFSRIVLLFVYRGRCYSRRWPLVTPRDKRTQIQIWNMQMSWAEAGGGGGEEERQTSTNCQLGKAPREREREWDRPDGARLSQPVRDPKISTAVCVCVCVCVRVCLSLCLSPGLAWGNYSPAKPSACVCPYLWQAIPFFFLFVAIYKLKGAPESLVIATCLGSSMCKYMHMIVRSISYALFFIFTTLNSLNACISVLLILTKTVGRKVCSSVKINIYLISHARAIFIGWIINYSGRDVYNPKVNSHQQVRFGELNYLKLRF